MFNFEELDSTTRQYMLSEFHAEEASGNPYRSSLLSPTGLTAFPKAMEEALLHGNEGTLANALSDSVYWHPFDQSGKRVNPASAAERLALTEFNTWYVRGLARRLMEEDVQYCEVYRAAPAWKPRQECLEHEGATYAVREIYEGHRARYWPQGDPKVLSIPAGPYCHHSIRRVRS